MVALTFILSYLLVSYDQILASRWIEAEPKSKLVIAVKTSISVRENSLVYFRKNGPEGCVWSSRLLLIESPVALKYCTGYERKGKKQRYRISYTVSLSNKNSHFGEL